MLDPDQLGAITAKNNKTVQMACGIQFKVRMFIRGEEFAVNGPQCPLNVPCYPYECMEEK